MSKQLSKTYLAERDRTIYQLRTMGLSAHQIAERMSLTSGQVQSALQRHLIRLNKQFNLTYPEILRLELDRLDRLQASFWPLTQHRVIDIEGEQIQVEPDTKAADTVLKIMDRRAKLLGLDSQTIRHEIDMQAEIRSTLAGHQTAEARGVDHQAEAKQLLDIFQETGIFDESAMKAIMGQLELQEPIDVEVVDEARVDGDEELDPQE